MALDDIAQRVSDQQRVDSGIVEHAREGCVVTGQHGDLLAKRVHLTQIVQGHGLAAVHGLILIYKTFAI